MKIEEPSTASLDSPVQKNQMSVKIQHLASARSKEISDSEMHMNFESRLEFLQDSIIMGSTLNREDKN
jgi:hypothetical protein